MKVAGNVYQAIMDEAGNAPFWGSQAELFYCLTVIKNHFNHYNS